MAQSARGNICQSEQNSRLRASLVALTLALAIAVVTSRSGSPLVARASVFVPLFFAVTWLLQALGKT